MVAWPINPAATPPEPHFDTSSVATASKKKPALVPP